jgi:drug/metabolite transporter (DMT)-like permease
MTEAATTAAASDNAAVLRGRILVLLAGAGMSLGGLFIRSIQEANEWQILFWRSLGIIAALLVFIAFRSQGHVFQAFRAAGAKSVIAGLCLAAGFTCFIFSITHTTVANTLFMLSAAPFITAALSRVLLGEDVTRGTWLAMLGAAAGIAIMVGEGFAAGDLFGNLMALAAAVGFAGFSIALRSGRGVDMMPATCLAGFFGAIGSAVIILASGGDFDAPTADIGICVAYGVVAIGGSLIVYTLGSRLVSAAELTLLSLSEVVLGPIWVWLAFAETPSGLTLLGGAILLAAIAGRAATGITRRRPPIGVV